MPRKAKTPKFTAFNSFKNCFGPRQTHKGAWQEYLDDKPLVLEIGCGKAEFLLKLADDQSNNYLGIDLKADRLYKPAKQALEEKLNNIAFIQTDVKDLLEYFDTKSVSEIWLTFPDPYPKDRHAKRRMTGREYQALYHKLLKNDGVFHFKTDDHRLFNWTLSEIKVAKLFEVEFKTNNLHNEPNHDKAKTLTSYETRFTNEGLNINYLKTTPVK